MPHPAPLDSRPPSCFLGIVLCTIVLLASAWLLPMEVRAESCETVVRELNRHLPSPVDEQELLALLKTLNATGNRRLPSSFVTKREARALGWRPGKNLWSSRGLYGKSIGGDRFFNREGKLPNGRRTWREADLGYKGGRRGAKRLIWSDDGLRRVTVDHYSTFCEVPSCQ